MLRSQGNLSSPSVKQTEFFHLLCPKSLPFFCLSSVHIRIASSSSTAETVSTKACLLTAYTLIQLNFIPRLFSFQWQLDLVPTDHMFDREWLKFSDMIIGYRQQALSRQSEMIKGRAISQRSGYSLMYFLSLYGAE